MNRLAAITVIVPMLLTIAGCSIGGQFGYDDLKKFPTDWPPPRASAYTRLAPETFQDVATVGQALSRIARALENNGYTDPAYWETQDGGIALVTKIERFADDGSNLPIAKRWSETETKSSSGFATTFRNMYMAEEGHFRVFVFILGPAMSPERSPQLVSHSEARAWSEEGNPGNLPPAKGGKPLGDAVCTVLLYEFEGPGRQLRLVRNSSIPAGVQLQKAGIIKSLDGLAKSRLNNRF